MTVITEKHRETVREMLAGKRQANGVGDQDARCGVISVLKLVTSDRAAFVGAPPERKLLEAP